MSQTLEPSTVIIILIIKLVAAARRIPLRMRRDPLFQSWSDLGFAHYHIWPQSSAGFALNRRQSPDCFARCQICSAISAVFPGESLFQSKAEVIFVSQHTNIPSTLLAYYTRGVLVSFLVCLLHHRSKRCTLQRWSTSPSSTTQRRTDGRKKNCHPDSHREATVKSDLFVVENAN